MEKAVFEAGYKLIEYVKHVYEFVHVHKNPIDVSKWERTWLYTITLGKQKKID